MKSVGIKCSKYECMSKGTVLFLEDCFINIRLYVQKHLFIQIRLVLHIIGDIFLDISGYSSFGWETFSLGGAKSEQYLLAALGHNFELLVVRFVKCCG